MNRKRASILTAAVTLVAVALWLLAAGNTPAASPAASPVLSLAGDVNFVGAVDIDGNLTLHGGTIQTEGGAGVGVSGDMGIAGGLTIGDTLGVAGQANLGQTYYRRPIQAIGAATVALGASQSGLLVTLDASTGDSTVQLPTAGLLGGVTFTISRVGNPGFTATVDGLGNTFASATGPGTIPLPVAGDRVTVTWNGSFWVIS